MKFACPKCSTPHSIADSELPAGKTLRFVCPQCGHTLGVRRKDDPARSAASVPESMPALPPVHHAAPPTAEAYHPPPAAAPVSVANTLGAPIAPTGTMPQPGVPSDPARGAKPIHARPPAAAQPLPHPAGAAPAAAPIAGRPPGAKVQAHPSSVPGSLDPAPIAAAAHLPATAPQSHTAGQGPDSPFDDAVATVKRQAPAPAGMAHGRSVDAAPAATDQTDSQDNGDDSDGLLDDFDDSPTPEPVYTNAPPGQTTRVFMRTAGIYRRERNLKIAAIGAGGLVTLVVGLLIADLTGLISIPFLGAVYDMTGLADPDPHRALTRTQTELSDDKLSPADRDRLRRKLLGLADDSQAAGPARRRPAHTADATPVANNTDGVGEAPALDKPDHAMATEVYNNIDKHDHAVPESDDAPAANAPAGLSQSAVTKVVHDNNRSLALCYADASRKGSVPNGKMEVQLTITPQGDVADAQILTERFKNSPMGRCTVRRVKNWKFPRFNGEAVTVAFPYVLQSGF